MNSEDVCSHSPTAVRRIEEGAPRLRAPGLSRSVPNSPWFPPRAPLLTVSALGVGGLLGDSLCWVAGCLVVVVFVGVDNELAASDPTRHLGPFFFLVAAD